jgi:tRNA threonylcarbamoyladenosine biosynthesis protein TsaB
MQAGIKGGILNLLMTSDICRYMYEPAYKLLRKRRFEDIAYFEPYYLKDFITSRPKKNILGR